jgi:hypothetical protein
MDERQTVELMFDFNSIVDPTVGGNGTVGILIDDDKVYCNMTIKYADSSTYKPRVVKSFRLNGVRDTHAKKVLVGSAVTNIDQHMSLLISFTGVFPVAYYSSNSPADCGTVKIRGNASSWKEAFGMN